MSQAPPSVRPRPVFWQEIYWFVVITLLGSGFAFWMLPPRLARNRTALDMEEGLQGTVVALENVEKKYEAAIAAVENDPFYREEVYRDVLKVKKKGEEFLKDPARISDN